MIKYRGNSVTVKGPNVCFGKKCMYGILRITSFLCALAQNKVIWINWNVKGYVI